MFRLPESIKKELDNYAHTVREFIEGRVSWARFSGVRVPWGNYSHRGGKIFMARIRIPAGALTPKQLKALAFCSGEYGNANLHLTTREDIQIHQVKIDDVIKIHRYLKDYELSSRGGGGNSVRNIIACPLAGICTEEAFDVGPDAVSLTEHLLSLEDSYSMPRKFKIAFSGCQADCVKVMVNDVGLLALKRDSKLGYRVYAGGGMGAKSSKGRLLEEFIDRKDIGYVVSAIKGVFYKHGDRRNKHHNRLRFLIEDIGFDRFLEYYKKELEFLKENEAIVLRKINFPYPRPLDDENIKSPQDPRFEDFLKYSCIEQKQKGSVAVKLRIPRGDLGAREADSIASLEEDFPGIGLRTSQEQNLYLTNIPKSRLPGFYAKAKEIFGEFLYPSTLLDVVSCKGSLTCNLGLCNSPGLAKEIERIVRDNFIGTKVFQKIKLKINGCPNACGHHPIGIVSFHGVARKVGARAVPFYRLLLGGRAGINTTELAEDSGILIPAKSVPLFLKGFLQAIDKGISLDSDIDKYIRAEGKKLAIQISKEYLHVPTYEEDRNFYIDWGEAKEFSLEGLGPGECGSGVLDMIEADLAEARIALGRAEEENFSPELIKKALFLASRALLVVKGSDPKTPKEAFSAFKEKFVDQGIASGTFSGIDQEYENTREELSLNEKKERFSYAQRFLTHINGLYKVMDSGLNFPKSKAERGESYQEVTESMDLKGTPCPMNYVKVKLRLEDLESGQTLEVLLDEGEPINNVPKSLEGDGHQILKIEKQDGFYKVLVKKK